MHIGERILELRNQEGISQTNLAKSIGATRAAVNAWEAGLSNPSAQSLKDLSSHFHVTTDYLLGLKEEEMISLERLSSEEKQIIRRLIHQFEHLNRLEKAAQ